MLSAIFDGYVCPGTGWRVSVREDKPLLDFQSIFIEIHTPNGKFVGDAGRQFYFDEEGSAVANHGTMHLTERFQGQGFNSRLNQHCIDRYRELGIHRIELNATGTGQYAWSRWPEMHFDPRDGREPKYPGQTRRMTTYAARRLAGAFEALPEQVAAPAVAAGHLPAHVAQRELGLIPREGRPVENKALTPYEISSLGWEFSWPDGKTGRRTWLGRELVLAAAANWSGVLFL
jgi:GNAT superfamily N-acetyltransferase